MKQDDVKIIEEKEVYRGFLCVKKYLLKHKRFQGDWSQTFTREILARPNAAAVLPYDPHLDRVVLIEQFRIGGIKEMPAPWFIEVVAGLIQDNETPAELVHREAQEEAGLTILDLLPIYDYWVSPGATDERVTLFCGKVNAATANGIHGLPEENEDIRVFTVSAQEAFDMVDGGEIKNAICLLTLLWLRLHRDEVRAKWIGSVDNSTMPCINR